MIITDKMIRELQRRVEVSYEDAERYLRRAGGNIDMAEAHIRRKKNSFFHRLFKGIENLINITFIYRLKVYRKEDVFIDMPVFLFFVLLFIIGMDKTITTGVIFIIIALVAECQLKLHKIEKDEKFSFYRTVKKENTKTLDVSFIEEDETIHKESDMNKKNKIKSQKNHVPAEEKQIEKSGKNRMDEEIEEYYEVTIDK